jgi:hypothetical protein
MLKITIKNNLCSFMYFRSVKFLSGSLLLMKECSFLNLIIQIFPILILEILKFTFSSPSLIFS